MTTEVKLAGLIRVERSGQGFRFEVDGQTFPWFIGTNGLSVHIGASPTVDVPGVTFTLIAERVEIVDDLMSGPRAIGARTAGEVTS